MIRSASLEAPNVAHAFFTRQGGVSTGIYASLNCGIGSNDEPDAVIENRRRIAAEMSLPNSELVTVYQVHGNGVVRVEGAWPDQPPRADGMVSASPGVILGILTADCAPVLFADSNAGVVGAAHCGWRGTLDGVAERVIDAMVEQGAERARIKAAVGPCIAQSSYEVGEDFRVRFLAEDTAAEEYFSPGRAGHAQFDLPGYVLRRLERAQIASAEWTGQDTYCEEAAFFSYRRTTHRNEPDYGRQVSAIALAR